MNNEIHSNLKAMVKLLYIFFLYLKLMFCV